MINRLFIRTLFCTNILLLIAVSGIFGQIQKSKSVQIDTLNKTDSLISDFKKSHQGTPGISNLAIADTLYPKTKLDVLNTQLQNASDSLTQKNKRYYYHDKYDSIQNRVASKVDSLNKLRLPIGFVRNKTDSLKVRIDSLKNARPFEAVKNVDGKISKLQSGVDSRLDSAKGKLNAKGKLFSQNGAELPDVKLPGTDSASDLKISDKLPDINLNNGSNLDLPGIGSGPRLNLTEKVLPSPIDKTPGVEVFDNGIKLPDTRVGDLKGIADIDQLDKLKDLDKLKEAKENAGDLMEMAREADSLQNDIKDIANADKGKLEQYSKEAQSKVEGLDQLKGLEDKLSQVDQQKAMVDEWNSDPEVQKEMALNKAKEESVDHFAGHEQQLTAALSKMADLKSKYKEAEGILDIAKKRQANPMKGKPFIERLIPGITLQFQKPNTFWMDINTQVTYRLTGRFSLVAGWNERIPYNFKQEQFSWHERMYGIRSSVHVKVREGFWFKTDVEHMHTFVRNTPLLKSSDMGSFDWVWNYFAGFKKDFRFSNSLLGNVQAMYSLRDPKRTAAYVTRFNMRIGFEIPLTSNNQTRIR